MHWAEFYPPIYMSGSLYWVIPLLTAWHLVTIVKSKTVSAAVLCDTLSSPVTTVRTVVVPPATPGDTCLLAKHWAQCYTSHHQLSYPPLLSYYSSSFSFSSSSSSSSSPSHCSYVTLPVSLVSFPQDMDTQLSLPTPPTTPLPTPPPNSPPTAPTPLPLLLLYLLLIVLLQIPLLLLLQLLFLLLFHIIVLLLILPLFLLLLRILILLLPLLILSPLLFLQLLLLHLFLLLFILIKILLKIHLLVLLLLVTLVRLLCVILLQRLRVTSFHFSYSFYLLLLTTIVILLSHLNVIFLIFSPCSFLNSHLPPTSITPSILGPRGTV